MDKQLEGDSECGENSNSQMTFPEFSFPPSPSEPASVSRKRTLPFKETITESLNEVIQDGKWYNHEIKVLRLSVDTLGEKIDKNTAAVEKLADAQLQQAVAQQTQAVAQQTQADALKLMAENQATQISALLALVSRLSGQPTDESSSLEQ